MARLTRGDWCSLGLAGLREGGEAAIGLDAITARAERSRGSFYHHFESHSDFVEAISADWRERSIGDLSAAAAREAPEMSAPIAVVAAMADRRLERALRCLALRAPAVAADIAAVDTARLDLLRALQASPESDAAADYALIEYASLIGLQTLTPDASEGRIAALGALTAEMIAAHWNE